LPTDARVGKGTLEALNVPVETRIDQDPRQHGAGALGVSRSVCRAS
jgi:hypothetical protein